MKPQDQRIAIAEACGWNRAPEHDYRSSWAFVREGYLAFHPKERHTSEIPNYLADLDAMHEAEKELARYGSLWLAELTAVVGFKYPVPYGSEEYDEMIVKVARATAAQRAEAFLKTIGRWKE